MKIYSDTTAADGTRRVSLLGIRVYKKWKAAGAVKRAWFQVLFKSVRRAYVVRYYLLGIRIHRKKDFFNLLKDTNAKLNTLRKDTGARLSAVQKDTGARLSAVQKDLASKVRSIVMDETRNALIVARQHQKVFPRFKNIHQGQSVVIVGAGQTLNLYSPIHSAKHIALNRACSYNKARFDYLFAEDYLGIKAYLKEILNYDCVKFFGEYINKVSCGRKIPLDILQYDDSIFHYYVDSNSYLGTDIPRDISLAPLRSMGTVAHTAIMFALWTHPRRLYLAGCDCSISASAQGSVYYDNMPLNESLEHYEKAFQNSFNGYVKIKNFCETYYPDVEIISINPVGLKGVFRDVYTNEKGSYTDEGGNLLDVF